MLHIVKKVANPARLTYANAMTIIRFPDAAAERRGLGYLIAPLRALRRSDEP